VTVDIQNDAQVLVPPKQLNNSKNPSKLFRGFCIKVFILKSFIYNIGGFAVIFVKVLVFVQ